MIFAEGGGVLEGLMGRTVQQNMKYAENGGVLEGLMGRTLQQTSCAADFSLLNLPKGLVPMHKHRNTLCGMIPTISKPC